ncbi:MULTISPECIES: hypothetical protein [Nitrospirillum]|uniref:Uncharacterized protein n=2 Tax=Nitrospirillum TaxID=1543705 RepID=A0A248JL50_9PROT|nr:hypothetical protein [Nitrospirillum amazonense]ASG19475.1 hypothetical protein Y958_00515 [Nitrospirillum amazonense CBAmc]MDG3440418.1 hypothetical protein [Nitrospirillum amazonense]MEC4593266.1 hypothetical protein [Nitrospirillum amazonense]TWB18869.1 hypothetical protein FBZ88_12325 [Nitrospirillum amazonense]TWB42013.1 hypothetical protein FBZ91_10325 [Nitrospirillum amazonense]
MAGADDLGGEDSPKRAPRASRGSGPDGAPGGNVVNAERLRRQGDRIREIERLMWGARAFAEGDDPDNRTD